MAQTLESGFVTTLAAKLAAADTTMTVATAPTVTKGRLFLKSGSVKEWIKFTGVSGTTLTGLVRGLSKTADPSVTGTGLTWVAGTTVTLVEMHDQRSDKQEGLPTKIYATTTTRDADITSPSNGMQVYVTGEGQFTDYVAGAWVNRASGTNPNASATVAGKVEIATTAQSVAGTDTGETGALLSVIPSDIAKNVQSATFIYGADAGGDDTYVVALTPVLGAYTTGQRLRAKFTTANTGACSVDFGPGVKSIKLVDGTDPANGDIAALGTYDFIYDGTNMVLQNIAIRATSAEALTGTDPSKYMTPLITKDSIKDSIGVPTTGLSAATNYQASVSGIVTAYATRTGSCSVTGYVGAADPATTKLVQSVDNTGGGASCCFPVKKGYYYRVDASADVFGMAFTPNV